MQLRKTRSETIGTVESRDGEKVRFNQLVWQRPLSGSAVGNPLGGYRPMAASHGLPVE